MRQPLRFVADRAGTFAALALLVVQPLGLARLAYASRGAPQLLENAHTRAGDADLGSPLLRK